MISGIKYLYRNKSGHLVQTSWYSDVIQNSTLQIPIDKPTAQ